MMNEQKPPVNISTCYHIKELFHNALYNLDFQSDFIEFMGNESNIRFRNNFKSFSWDHASRTAIITLNGAGDIAAIENCIAELRAIISRYMLHVYLTPQLKHYFYIYNPEYLKEFNNLIEKNVGEISLYAFDVLDYSTSEYIALKIV
jgi:hypothetical protein